MKSDKLLVIIGPTASGKTDLAIELAKKLNGEIIACDSRQVYRGLDIGTGKLPAQISNIKYQISKDFWEIDGVKIWMYDVISLNSQYTVSDYVKDSKKVLEDINNRKKLPILVGGTGLYEKALLKGFSSLQVPLNIELRKKLMNLSLIQLQAKIKEISIKKWTSLNNSDQNNPRRLIRAIEIEMNKKNKDNMDILENQGLENEYDILKIGLTFPREILYEKINKRVYQWIEEGIVEEVKKLTEKGVSKQRFGSLGLEYAVVQEYLEGKINIEEMIEKMQTKVRQYSRRQITWFKKEQNVSWFNLQDKNQISKIENLVTKWYDKDESYASEN